MTHFFLPDYAKKPDNLSKNKNIENICYIQQMFYTAAGYADDINLLCPTNSWLRRMIEVCEEYANLHYVLFNGSKSKQE